MWSGHKNLGLNILYGNFVLNFAASVISTTLIFYMWKKGTLNFNVFNKCVVQLIIWQGMYEFWCPLLFEVANPFEHEYLLNPMATFGTSMGGLGSSLWSFLILLSALFPVEYGRLITGNEQVIGTAVVYTVMIGYSIHMAIAGYYSPSNIDGWNRGWLQYDYMSFSIISLILLCFLRLYYKMMVTSIRRERSRSPLYHLLKRVVPYPVIISISRSGAGVYKQLYRATIISFPLFGATSAQTFWYYYGVVMMPFAGIGTLITFICVQPGAWRSLIQMLHMERILTLPPPPVNWGEPGIGLSKDHRDGEPVRESHEKKCSKYQDKRPSTSSVQRDNEQLENMSEMELAVALTRKYLMHDAGQSDKSAASRGKGMADNEEGVGNTDPSARGNSGSSVGIDLPNYNSRQAPADYEDEEGDDYYNYRYSDNNEGNN